MSSGPTGSEEILASFSGAVYSIIGIGLSPALPVGPSEKRIEPGDLVVVDIPTLVGGYHAGQTLSSDRILKQIGEGLKVG